MPQWAANIPVDLLGKYTGVYIHILNYHPNLSLIRHA